MLCFMLRKCFFIYREKRVYTLKKNNRLHLCHEEFKDKRFEIEISWICPETNFQHQMIPKDLKVISFQDYILIIFNLG